MTGGFSGTLKLAWKLLARDWRALKKHLANAPFAQMKAGDLAKDKR